MAESKWQVTGMTCQHCVRSVTEEVSLIEGVEHVAVDLVTGAVTVSGRTTPTREQMESAVAEAGYSLT